MDKRAQLVKAGKAEPLAITFARRDLGAAVRRALRKLDPVDVREICDKLIPVVEGKTPILTLEAPNV